MDFLVDVRRFPPLGMAVFTGTQSAFRLAGKVGTGGAVEKVLGYHPELVSGSTTS